MEAERKDELDQEDRENNSRYMDWLSDNKEYLRDEFIEENQEKFNEFCKEQYNILDGG